ncbi:MAG TPA: hypothetical protein VJV03_15200 [Pyrinomonadaceae bacterium]|nr:hypothetical protein [Pyrinomonadaceae bacterium]
MSNYDPRVFEAEMRSAPSRVKNACIISWLLAVILAVRFIVITQPSAKTSLFFLGWIFFNYVFNAVGLLARSKLSYVMLAFFSSLSLLGGIEAILAMIRLLVTDEWQNNSTEIALGCCGVVVTAVIALLFRNLFSKEARSWVWSRSKTVTQQADAATC